MRQAAAVTIMIMPITITIITVKKADVVITSMATITGIHSPTTMNRAAAVVMIMPTRLNTAIAAATIMELQAPLNPTLTVTVF